MEKEKLQYRLMNLYPPPDQRWHESLTDANKLSSYNRAGVIAVAFDDNNKVVSVTLLSSKDEKDHKTDL